MRVLIVLVVVAGCVGSSSVTCPSGYTCPEGLLCAELTMPMPEHLCVKQNQLDACSDPTMVVACSTPDIPTGACHEGVCLPASCGNSLVDPGEACDDGNQRPDDMCSSDCTS